MSRQETETKAIDNETTSSEGLNNEENGSTGDKSTKKSYTIYWIVGGVVTLLVICGLAYWFWKDKARKQLMQSQRNKKECLRNFYEAAAKAKAEGRSIVGTRGQLRAFYEYEQED